MIRWPDCLMVPKRRSTCDRLKRVHETAIRSEQVDSRLRLLHRHIDYINDKVLITEWLIRRSRGLPDSAETAELTQHQPGM